MKTTAGLRFRRLLAALLVAWQPLHGRAEEAQATTVNDIPALSIAVARFLSTNHSVEAKAVLQQLDRTRCRLDLPPRNATRLSEPELQARAWASHLRVGWSYRCRQCPEQHLELASGFVITRDGTAVTSYHVAAPPRDLTEGCLIAVDANARVHAVSEILAAERYSDVCILRLSGTNFTPLPLSTNAQVGDAVCCLGSASKQSSGFRRGVIERVFELPERRRIHERGAPYFKPTRFHATTDWSAGDSGSAVLDPFGNAVGMVCATTPVAKDGITVTSLPATKIVTREAVGARDVMTLIEAKARK